MTNADRDRSVWALAFALAGFAAFRLTGLTRYPPWEDEWITLLQTSGSLMAALRWLADDQTNPPLSYALIWAWQKIGGGGLAWMRLLPAMLGTLTAWPMLALCRHAGLSRDAARLAVLIAAASPFLVFFSLELRSYALFALLVACALAAWFDARERDDRRSWVVVGGVTAALVMTHYFGLFFVACAAVDAGRLDASRRRRAMTALAVACAPLVPWLAYVVHRVQPGAAVLATASGIVRPDPSQLLDPVVRAIGVSPWLGADLAVAATVVALAAIAIVRETPQRGNRILLAAVAVVPAVVTMGISLVSSRSFWITRYFVAGVVPLVVLAAAGAAELLPPAARRWIPFAALWPVALSVAAARDGREKVPFDQLMRAMTAVGPDSATIFTTSVAEGGPLAWLAAHGGGRYRVVVVDSPAAIDAPRGWVVWSEHHPPAGPPPVAQLARLGFAVGAPLAVTGQFDDLKWRTDSVVAVPFARRLR